MAVAGTRTRSRKVSNWRIAAGARNEQLVEENTAQISCLKDRSQMLNNFASVYSDPRCVQLASLVDGS